MSIYWRNQSDILDNTMARMIVIPVNCHGVAGAGLAKQADEKWPEAMRAYREACQNRTMAPGRLLVVRRAPASFSPFLGLFATKGHWRDPSRLTWINQGLKDLAHLLWMFEPDTFSVAVPALGCGLGGLDWIDVQRLIAHHLCDVPQAVYVYPPRRN